MSEPQRPRILLVDDEIQIRRILRLSLESAQFSVFEASTGAQAVNETATLGPDGIILDLGLPDIDGLDVLKRVRSWSQVPVLVLTVRNGEDDMVGALDAGADDYLSKPFRSRELLARLRAILRRTETAAVSTVVAFGDVEVDLAARVVRRAGAEVKLTGKEFELLAYLARHKGRVVTHPQILRALWGAYAEDNTHYLRVHMTHLRRKLEADPGSPRHLKTDSGVGYRLVDA